MQFSGALTAIVTPFRNGAIDEEAYRSLIEWQIEEGINGIVPCGTTGESATLSYEEHREVVRICIDQVNKRVPVLAGAGSNSTKEAIGLAQCAKDAGADGALLITPYYNKPTQEGLYQHFKAIAREVALPFVLYNVPGRTSVNLCAQTVARIQRDIPEVIGIKEASADLKQASEILEFCDPDFQVFSGDDFTSLPLLAIGGCGVISVVSNLVPGKMAKLCAEFFAGNLDTAQSLHYELAPLARDMFCETNPIPVKTALSMMGKLKLELRLPLVPMQPQHEKHLRETLALANLV